MEKHQKVAIICAIILSIVSSIPIFIAKSVGYGNEYFIHPEVLKIWIFPVIGVSISATLVVISFLFRR